MNKVNISLIFIDNNRICIKPQSGDYDFVYRSAMGVYWAKENCYLFPEIQGTWSYVQWFVQILKAVKNEYGCILYITDETKWENIDDITKAEIKSFDITKIHCDDVPTNETQHRRDCLPR